MSGRVEEAEKLPNGLLADRAALYGMEDFPLSLLNVIDGDLAPLSDPSQNAVAAVYMTDDYGQTARGSHWAGVGDRVTIRYVEEYEHFYTDTGEIIPEFNESVTGGERPWSSRAKIYRDVEYTVCAIVNVPDAMSYRYYGADQFVMGAERFMQDSQSSSIMTYVFNTAEGAAAGMEQFLAEYTEIVQPLYNYESKTSYQAEFEGFRGMFLTMGGALAAIVGLVGVLNFINAVLTGIITRKREFAVLQAIGMTGRQLKVMLVYEGLYYTMLAAGLSLALSVALGPVMGRACSSFLWFFTYRFTVLPVVVITPLFLTLGCAVPLLTYRTVEKHTVVERLRESE